VLLPAELLLPTGGILFAAGLIAIGAGVFVSFLISFNVGLLVLLSSLVGTVLMFGLIAFVWRRTPLGRRFVLHVPEEDATVAALPANQNLERLKGRIGRALSSLRPAGVVDFEGRRVDSITEGMMVEPGEYVRCIDVQAGKVIVRPVEKPDLGDLETAEFD
jgi:membrane-bound serine protease (ClpP class)